MSQHLDDRATTPDQRPGARDEEPLTDQGRRLVGQHDDALEGSCRPESRRPRGQGSAQGSLATGLTSTATREWGSAFSGCLMRVLQNPAENPEDDLGGLDTALAALRAKSRDGPDGQAAGRSTPSDP